MLKCWSDPPNAGHLRAMKSVTGSLIIQPHFMVPRVTTLGRFHCIYYIYIYIRESVDSLCRDGADARIA